jgi:hypothetical protein
VLLPAVVQRGGDDHKALWGLQQADSRKQP